MSPPDNTVALMARKDSDEFYVLDLCDTVIGTPGSRQHLFDWLLGDTSPKTGRALRLPVDAYWPEHHLVVEFRERQHYEAVAHFDKPDRLTVSGVHRGEQRRIYDQRREELIPSHNIRLVIINTTDFVLAGKKIRRTPEKDLATVTALLNA